ncbi:hypothetical protein ACLKA6_005694 [Drosophila palustris]
MQETVDVEVLDIDETTTAEEVLTALFASLEMRPQDAEVSMQYQRKPASNARTQDTPPASVETRQNTSSASDSVQYQRNPRTRL